MATLVVFTHALPVHLQHFFFPSSWIFPQLSQLATNQMFAWNCRSNFLRDMLNTKCKGMGNLEAPINTHCCGHTKITDWQKNFPNIELYALTTHLSSLPHNCLSSFLARFIVQGLHIHVAERLNTTENILKRHPHYSTSHLSIRTASASLMMPLRSQVWILRDAVVATSEVGWPMYAGLHKRPWSWFSGSSWTRPLQQDSMRDYHRWGQYPESSVKAW